MEKRKALGKGLQALIPEVSAQDTESILGGPLEAIIHLKVADIKPSRYQPRSSFDKEKLEELIMSIKEKGVVQPVLVRKTASGYELIAGERRLRAVKSLGIDTLPVIIKDVDDQNAMELALIENIQRDDLNPIEEARAYQCLHKEFAFTQEKIAQQIGKDRASVTNTLRLLNLPQKIQQFILDDLLTMGHARALLGISDGRKQMKLCEKIIRKGLSVREAEHLVRPRASQRKASSYQAQDLHAKAVEDDLQQTLGTKVRIQHGKKRGKVVIEYFSPSDLDRIIKIIKR